jgi:predicted nucleic acid-binding protein
VKALLDTNLYIDFLNEGRHAELVESRLGLVRYMSVVVVAELELGATTKNARVAVARLARTFERAGRLVVPSGDVWGRAGSVLRSLRTHGREIRRASLVNDMVIALTARDIGATLFSRDASDYLAIRRCIDFRYENV